MRAPAPRCSVCNDRGYTYRGGRRVPCHNLSCHARSDFHDAESKRTMAETRARMALINAHDNFSYGMAVREATKARVSLDTIKRLTGLSTTQIRAMQKGQGSFLA